MVGPEDAPGDDALVVAIRDRNHDALREVYRRHGGAVWSAAKQVCSSAASAEVVCQKVFTELWSDPGRFDLSRRGLRSWLVGQAVLFAFVGGRSVPAAQLLGQGGGTAKADIRRALMNLRPAPYAEGVTT